LKLAVVNIINRVKKLVIIVSINKMGKGSLHPDLKVGVFVTFRIPEIINLHATHLIMSRFLAVLGSTSHSGKSTLPPLSTASCPIAAFGSAF